MKELDSFTVERLEEFIRQPLENGLTRCEQMELARIALAAKRAEPDYYIVRLKFNDGWGDETVLDTYETKIDASKSKDDHGGEIIPAYTTPQLNSQVPLGSWINCSDQMPEVGDVVITAYQGCTNVGQMERSGKTYRYFTSIVSGRELPATHWMPLPAAPEKPL
ncbi:Protein of uncharacterised function (DUF551) [Yersinia rohdei]|uniref:DUF551 domain-containing protein n=1 Tax=Yersinia rohdei TaxID=29485 RepID=UPI0005E115EB|nr:DUF551 domain-containing protein [Yersinia rohdei]CNJ37492.1 Protein of uncharacterised function (DUF551) [Yersinia rohdei]